MLKISKKNIGQYLYYKLENVDPENSKIWEHYPAKTIGEFVYIGLKDIYNNFSDRITFEDNILCIPIPDEDDDSYSAFKSASISIVIDDQEHLHLYLENFGNKKYNTTYKDKWINLPVKINEVIVTRDTYFNEITIENEVEIILGNNHFKNIFCDKVPLNVKTLDGKKISIEKLTLRESILDKVKQRISKIEMLEVLDKDTDIILENCNLYFIYPFYPDNDRIHVFNCEIKYKRSLFTKYASYFRDPRMLNNFQSIYEILLKKDYLKKYSVELHKYVLYFNARKSYLKRFFYLINQGYYSIIGPAIILSVLLVININVMYRKPIIIEHNTLTYLINPGEFFRLVKDDYDNSFLLWIARMLNRIIFYYSLFSVIIAIKRKYGFTKKSDLQL